MKTLMILLLLVMSVATRADDARPLYFSITEKQPLVYALEWRIPSIVAATYLPDLILPNNCKPLTGDQTYLSGGSVKLASLVGKRLFQCSQSLAGRSIQIKYPPFSPLRTSLVKYLAASGESHTRMLAPEQYAWTIPHAESVSRVAREYTILGIQHIWKGIDHLLFLLCLIWIAGTWRRILITVTGFTLSHSITLALSALQVVRLPVPPVEAAIALSIVFLATEIAKDSRGSLSWRYPVAVSTAFGLLHGLGFAAVLDEIGLPQLELVTGLLFFNVGVEIGQLMFVVVALAIAMFRRLPASHFNYPNAVHLISIYSIGVLSMFWMAERCAQFL
jgi:hydrogenase/urease accessory protein HupE